MDLRTLLKILVRRWIVVVPTIVVAAIIGHQLISSVKPTYEAKGSLLLLTPVAKPVPGAKPAAGTTANLGADGNPFLPIAPLDKAATGFAEFMNDSGKKASIAKRGLISKAYTVTVDQNAPILRVDTKDSHAKIAVATTVAVLKATVDEIAALEKQHGVTPDQSIGTEILSTPTKATTINSAKTRALIAFIALAIAAVLSVALLVESWAQSSFSRRDRRRLKVASPSPAPVAAPGAAATSPPAWDRTATTAAVEADTDADAEEEPADSRPKPKPFEPQKQPVGRARAKPRRGSGAAS